MVILLNFKSATVLFVWGKYDSVCERERERRRRRRRRREGERDEIIRIKM